MRAEERLRGTGEKSEESLEKYKFKLYIYINEIHTHTYFYISLFRQFVYIYLPCASPGMCHALIQLYDIYCLRIIIFRRFVLMRN